MTTDIESIDISPVSVTPDRVCEALARVTAGSPTVDDLGIARNAIDVLKEFVARADAAWKAVALQYAMDAGPFQLGSDRFWADVTKTTKCTDAPATMRALLEATGGDESAMTDCLSVNAWKPSAVKKTLAAAGKIELFDRLFIIQTVDKLGVEKPKSLQSANMDFVK